VAVLNWPAIALSAFGAYSGMQPGQAVDRVQLADGLEIDQTSFELGLRR
jgi:hypothetical protein